VQIELTVEEIKALLESPDAIQALIDYHDCQETMGQAMGFACGLHANRKKELRQVKERVEANFE